MFGKWKFRVQEDFSPEICAIRKKLVEYMWIERKNGKHAVLSGDQLLINGKPYDLTYLEKNHPIATENAKRKNEENAEDTSVDWNRLSVELNNLKESICSLRSESTQSFETTLNEIYPTNKVFQMDTQQNFVKTRNFKRGDNWTLLARRSQGSLVLQDVENGTSKRSRNPTEPAEINPTHTTQQVSKSMPDGNVRARSPREGIRDYDSKRTYHLRSRTKHYPSNPEATF